MDRSKTSGANIGIIIMAHGGGTTWNKMVKNAALPLTKNFPVEFAWGMANYVTLQKAVSSLESQSVDRIIVVPLFISMYSPIFRQAEYLLGLRDELADPPMPMMHHTHEYLEITGVEVDDSQFVSNMLMLSTLEPVKLQTPITFTQALDDHPTVATILHKRILALSEGPSNETIVLVAHGPNDEDDNVGWVESMESLSVQIQKEQTKNTDGFKQIFALTVRDDASKEVHDQAKQHLRALVRQANIAGDVIVIPVFLSPGGREKSVAERLVGLNFKWSGETLLPDDEISDFLIQSVQEVL